MIELYIKFIPTPKSFGDFIDNRFLDIHVNCEGIANGVFLKKITIKLELYYKLGNVSNIFRF